MVHELNTVESNKNRDSVNFHQENKKRKFNEIGNMGVLRGVTSTESPVHTNLNNNLTGSSSSNINVMRRKVLLPSSLSAYYCPDEDAEKILDDTLQMKTREDIKEYLKKTLSQLISKYFLFYLFFRLEEKTGKVNVPLVKSENQEEIRKINEKLIKDNGDLKKAVVSLFRSRQEVKNIILTLFLNRLKRRLKRKKKN